MLDEPMFAEDAEYLDLEPEPARPRRRRRDTWRDRSFQVLLGLFSIVFVIGCGSVYYFLLATTRPAVSTSSEALPHERSAADAELPRSVNDHTVAIPNCGPDRAFSAFPERELVERTVHVFDCGTTRYILMPPVEGR